MRTRFWATWRPQQEIQRQVSGGPLRPRFGLALPHPCLPAGPPAPHPPPFLHQARRGRPGGRRRRSPPGSPPPAPRGAPLSTLEAGRPRATLPGPRCVRTRTRLFHHDSGRFSSSSRTPCTRRPAPGSHGPHSPRRPEVPPCTCRLLIPVTLSRIARRWSPHFRPAGIRESRGDSPFPSAVAARITAPRTAACT